MSQPEDRLRLDIQEDLDRVDRVMTQLIGDPVTTEEFIRNPSGVLTRLGLHPRTSDEVHDRTNRVFYAVLTNTELLEFLADHFRSFPVPADEDTEAERAALGRGEIAHSTSLDDAALDHVLSDPDVFRRIFQLALRGLNSRRLLLGVYSTEELDDYVSRLVDAIVDRRSIRDMPVLEEWDAQYGVGKGLGVGIPTEVATIVTGVVSVEVGLWVTVFLGIGSDLSTRAQSEALSLAVRGDPTAARTLATAGVIIRLAGEVLIHANNFERP